jgi:c-di-GMP-binding flagellar brake protein YcgR
MGKVRQIDIARVVGLDQGNVSKILNKWPKDTFAKSTIRKVFKAASRLGYVLPSIAKANKRVFPRRDFRAQALVKVCLQDGTIHSEGKAVVTNISASGMFLSRLDTKDKTLPLVPSYLEIYLTNSKLRGLKAKAKPVRFAETRGKLGLGLKFFDLTEKDCQRVKLFTMKKT